MIRDQHCRRTDVAARRRPPVDELSQQDDHRALLRDEDALASWRACRDFLTQKQWDVVVLLIQHRMARVQAGTYLGISPSAVSDRFRRARQIKMDFDKQLRVEKLEFVRQNLSE